MDMLKKLLKLLFHYLLEEQETLDWLCGVFEGACKQKINPMEVWRATNDQKSFGVFRSGKDLWVISTIAAFLLVQVWKLKYEETSWSWQLWHNKEEVERVKVRLDGAPTHFYKNLLAYRQSKKKTYLNIAGTSWAEEDAR